MNYFKNFIHFWPDHILILTLDNSNRIISQKAIDPKKLFHETILLNQKPMSTLHSVVCYFFIFPYHFI